MGTFNVAIELAAGPGGPFQTLDAVAGSGQLYSSVPSSILRSLGVERTGTRTFITPDGTRLERDVGWPVVRIGGREHPTLVVFGDEEQQALLGTLTLTMCGLEVDPEHEELVPLTAYLPGIRAEAAA